MNPQEAERIDRITGVISDLLKGGQPEPLKIENDPDDEITQLTTYVNNLLQAFGCSVEALQDTAKGDMAAEVHCPLALGHSVKALNSTLRHLAWQADQIAKGDFSQRTEFLGEFSVSFNWMVEQLAVNRDNLKKVVFERTRELNRSELRLRTVIESSIDAIVASDSRGLISLFNPAAEAMFGFERHEVIGRSVTCLIPAEMKAHHGKAVDGFLSGNQSADAMGTTMRVTAAHKTGRTFPIELSLSGGVIADEKFVFAIIRDVSEREAAEVAKHNLQHELEKAKRMESLAVLAGGVAHDLNNELGPLVGYPEMILMKLEPGNPIREQINKMAGAARRAVDTIQDLLTLARRGRYEMVPTSLNEVVQQYIDSPAHTSLCSRHPRVTVELKLDGDLPTISGSSVHLGKVVMNLVGNGMEAMPGGGRLTIETSQQPVERLLGGHEDIEKGDYVMLRVRDTGDGINPEDMARIFEPYFSKKVLGTSGSGLGLSVVYGIVKDHAGHHDIISARGKGTEFILYFPRTDAAADLTDEPETNLEGSERLLVVEDNQQQRDLAEELLHSLGYRVKSVANGNDATEFLSHHSVDLVILDMILEDGPDGLDTFIEIRKTHPRQKAIIVSGFSETDRVAELHKLGAGAFVRKPFTRTQLIAAVRGELERERSPREVVDVP